MSVATYELTEAPPAPCGSRYALAQTHAGWSVQGGVAGTIAHAYGQLLQQRREEAEAHRPEATEVRLLYPVRREGAWELVERGVVGRVPAFENVRPSKIWRGIQDGGQLLDSLFLGEEAWQKAPDAEVWGGLLAFCEQYDPDGATVRKLADCVSLLLLLRAGVDVRRPDLLPSPPS